MKVAASRTALAKPHAPSPAHEGGLLQRKCVCGGAASALTGQCEACGKKKLSGAKLQTKLAINQPGDVYEQEADRSAEAVMRMPELAGRTARPDQPAPPLVQRRVSGDAAGLTEAPPIVSEVLNAPGEPLDGNA